MTKCELCGRIIPPNYSLIESKTLTTICQDCYPLLGTCRTCTKAQHCPLEEDTSGEPKVIQQQQKVTLPNGTVMTAVVNTLNPFLVEKFCKPLCSCFSQENGCLRQNIGECNNYQ